MTHKPYVGFDKVIKDALVSARGKNLPGSREEKIRALEKILDTATLSQSELNDLQKQLRDLRSGK